MYNAVFFGWKRSPNHCQVIPHRSAQLFFSNQYTQVSLIASTLFIFHVNNLILPTFTFICRYWRLCFMQFMYQSRIFQSLPNFRRTKSYHINTQTCLLPLNKSYNFHSYRHLLLTHQTCIWTTKVVLFLFPKKYIILIYFYFSKEVYVVFPSISLKNVVKICSVVWVRLSFKQTFVLIKLHRYVSII